MNLAALSIKRPIFITSLVLLMLVTGWLSLKRLGVDLFPEVSFPFVAVNTIYSGAGPEEVEKLISKPLEEELSSISGLKRLTSRNTESVSFVFAEFYLDVDIKDAEQQVRNKVALARRNLPDDIEEPLISRFDPADQPIVRFSLFADLPPAELYDLAKEEIGPKFEQGRNVAAVKIVGGSRREIQVELDRKKLNLYQTSAVSIANQLRNYGVNVPVGKFDSGGKQVTFRTLGEFNSLKQIENVVINFGGEYGNALPLKTVGRIYDSAEEEESICVLYAPLEEETKSSGFSLFGKKDAKKVERITKTAVFLDVYKQSGTNTIEVANDSLKRMTEINATLKGRPGAPKLVVVRDGSVWIKMNVADVSESIILGIILAVLVVYLFLGNVRSTIITGLALPNSLLGAFILMYLMGFTVNVMTLLALSLSVGLLVDDAIVVRENIYRKIEDGMNPIEAAEKGTTEVTLAVIATTLTVIAVFLPVGFLSGIVGQFFKQFGLTVCFAMMISLFDALTVAPMLSAYFAGKPNHNPNFVIRAFDKFQTKLEELYGSVMKFALAKPLVVIVSTVGVFFFSLFIGAVAVQKTFLPPNDAGEYLVVMQMPPGTSLRGGYEFGLKPFEEIKKFPEVDLMSMVVTQDGITIGVKLVNSKDRKRTTTTMKTVTSKLLEKYAIAQPSVNDYSAVGGGVQYPLNMNVIGDDLVVLQDYSDKLVERFQKIKDLKDIKADYRTGKPEFQVVLDPNRMQQVGVTPGIAGSELRLHVAGGEVGKLRENGLEYDIRMRLKPEQRDLRSAYKETRVPNMNFRMIPLSVIAAGKEATGPEKISRQDRSRVITIQGNIAEGGALGAGTDEMKRILNEELPPPPGVRYLFFGQAEDMAEMFANIVVAFGMAILFIYLVLASLYESFITPMSILLAIPPAISGAFFALGLTRETMNIFSMIGIIMLLGLVTKNSILLVDYALQGIRDGLPRNEAIFRAGLVRLRPILMTTLAMIAGTLPIALGLGELAKQRQSMGIAIVGGLIVSTLLTLIVVPSIFGYIDRFREFIESKFRNKDNEPTAQLAMHNEEEVPSIRVQKPKSKRK